LPPSRRIPAVAVCDPSAGHAGAGGARSRTINDRISRNICFGTATSANRVRAPYAPT
jgi:hypothetical protein